MTTNILSQILLCSIRELVQLNKALSFKIVSLDTDVLVLSVDYLVNSPYPVEIEFELITSRGCRTLSVNTIVEELGEEKSKALLGSFVMTGCDHIGSINGITKQRSFNTYMQLTGHSWSVRALSRLGNSEHISAIDIEGLTEYVIKIYCSKMKDDETRYTEISDIEQLRWELYSKHQVNGDLLLPTPTAL